MKPSGKQNKLPHFLIISTTGIGDTLMSTPAIRALRESFPQSRIDVLVHSKRKELLWGNPYVDRLLEYRNNFFYRGLLLLQTLPDRYDHVLIFHANDDVWKILSMVHYEDCFNRQGYEDSKRRVIPLPPLPKHSVQKRLALVEKAGGEKSADYRYDFFIPPDDVQWAAKQMTRWGISPREKIVGMQMGAADSFKCWPVESFVQVAQYLRSRHGAKIFLNASPREKKLTDRFLDLFGKADVFASPGTALSQAAALIQACSLFISIDTGPMHLAIGLGVPLIGLFCPTDCRDTGPLGYGKAFVIQKGTPCTPCLTRNCRDNFCMKQISVEEVCIAADQMLHLAPPGR